MTFLGAVRVSSKRSPGLVGITDSLLTTKSVGLHTGFKLETQGMAAVLSAGLTTHIDEVLEPWRQKKDDAHTLIEKGVRKRKWKGEEVPTFLVLDGATSMIEFGDAYRSKDFRLEAVEKDIIYAAPKKEFVKEGKQDLTQALGSRVSSLGEALFRGYYLAACASTSIHVDNNFQFVLLTPRSVVAMYPPQVLEANGAIRDYIEDTFGERLIEGASARQRVKCTEQLESYKHLSACLYSSMRNMLHRAEGWMIHVLAAKKEWIEEPNVLEHRFTTAAYTTRLRSTLRQLDQMGHALCERDFKQVLAVSKDAFPIAEEMNVTRRSQGFYSS